MPVVAADGSIYVAFENGQHAGRYGTDQYMVVKVDPATGKAVKDPVVVADLVDHYQDYPHNIDGGATYQDSQFRTFSWGNITADPANALHLAVVWSDMRNSTLPAPADPYQAKTNSDIVMSQSFDGGKTWSAPTALAIANDQFMPWGAYNGRGQLQIGYYDRSYDPANHKYGYTLASETTPGSLNFTEQQVTTALSDPTQGYAFFRTTVNPSFPNASRFLGDYANIAISPNGVAALWTDMRLASAAPPPFIGSTEDAFFALVVDPPPPPAPALAAAPSIGSFTASFNAVTAGSPVTLTAADVQALNAGSTITQVAFYVDSNNNGVLEPGTDTLLGYGTKGSSGKWIFTFSTTGWTAGSYKLFAQALDSYGVFSDPFAITATVS